MKLSSACGLQVASQSSYDLAGSGASAPAPDAAVFSAILDIAPSAQGAPVRQGTVLTAGAAAGHAGIATSAAAAAAACVAAPSAAGAEYVMQASLAGGDVGALTWALALHSAGCRPLRGP